MKALDEMTTLTFIVLLLGILFNAAKALDDDDDDDEICIMLNLLLLAGTSYALIASMFPTRNPSVLDQRRCWNEYLERHKNNPKLHRHLRMSLDSFNKLLSHIRADLEVNERMAFLRGGAIIPEVCLFVTLRFLAGGSYLDIYDLMGISPASFYRVLWNTVRAICACEALKIKFPTTEAECREAALGFQSISCRGVIANCIGALDGYLLRIRTPTKKDAPNVRAYFSGHYQCNGINIQAVCDHLCRFIYFAVISPGSTGDNDAARQSGLFELLEALPRGFIVIADAAYTATEHLVSLYYGVDRSKALYDNFNFYGSQCRIRIEMAFGLMQQKWGILHRPLCCNLENAKWLILAIAVLHNFVINERQETIDQAPKGLAYMPSIPHNSAGDPIVLNQLYTVYPGNSFIREAMANRVQSFGLVRPSGNRIQPND